MFLSIRKLRILDDLCSIPTKALLTSSNIMCESHREVLHAGKVEKDLQDLGTGTQVLLLCSNKISETEDICPHQFLFLLIPFLAMKTLETPKLAKMELWEDILSSQDCQPLGKLDLFLPFLAEILMWCRGSLRLHQ